MTTLADPEGASTLVALEFPWPGPRQYMTNALAKCYMVMEDLAGVENAEAAAEHDPGPGQLNGFHTPPSQLRFMYQEYLRRYREYLRIRPRTTEHEFPYKQSCAWYALHITYDRLDRSSTDYAEVTWNDFFELQLERVRNGQDDDDSDGDTPLLTDRFGDTVDIILGDCVPNFPT